MHKIIYYNFMNLNSIKINCDVPNEPLEQDDFSLIGDDKDIEIYFKNIERQIINKIKKYDNVVGCIAWLTNENILVELAKKKSVLIIVQEEDFLRPDINFDGNNKKWKKKIFKLYNELQKNKKNIPLNCFGISYMQCGVNSGIRRLGKINENKLPAFPRMHNKFIICYNDFEFEIVENEPKDFKINGEILSGSYNYTENSNNSLENVVCIKDEEIVYRYYLQFAEIAIMSVPLDWNSEWNPSESELRYGS